MTCLSDANPVPDFEWSIIDESQNKTMDVSELEHWFADNVNSKLHKKV